MLFITFAVKTDKKPYVNTEFILFKNSAIILVAPTYSSVKTKVNIERTKGTSSKGSLTNVLYKTFGFLRLFM